MSVTTLALGGLLDAVSLALYVYAGLLVVRTLPLGRGLATEGFALFWFAVGIVNGLQAALIGVTLAQGDPGVALAESIWTTRIALALAGFGGLVYYLLYVYRGKQWLLAPLGLFYVTTFLLMEYWIAASDPVAAEIGPWRIGLLYAHDIAGPLFSAVVLMFFVPPLLAAGAYARLLLEVTDPEQRRRVRLISLSFAVYFVGMTAGYLNLSWSWWGLVENILGILAVVGVIVALRPGSASQGGAST